MTSKGNTQEKNLDIIQSDKLFGSVIGVIDVIVLKLSVAE